LVKFKVLAQKGICVLYLWHRSIFKGNIMSRAELRNANRVFEAALSINLNPSVERAGFMTVGEVAKCAYMGKATAKKYMDALVVMGSMERVTVTKTIVIYRFV